MSSSDENDADHEESDEFDYPQIVTGIHIPHLSIDTICHACNNTVRTGNYVVALFSNADSSAYDGSTQPFLVPPRDFDRVVVRKGPTEYKLCRRVKCARCTTGSPEAFVVHSDCLKLFETTGKPLAHIWSHAAWRKPWRKAPKIHKTLPPAEIDQQVVIYYATARGIPQMIKLPLELIYHIREVSGSSTFWRYAHVLSLAHRVSDLAPSPIVRWPIDEIESWTRDTGMVARTKSELRSSPCSQFVMLSMDAYGIYSLKRISTDEFISAHSQQFIVEDAKAFRDVVCELNGSGLMRLSLPPGHSGYRIWETAYPPAMKCTWSRGIPPPSSRIRAINLKDTKGLTFFYYRTKLYGIHSHTAESPYATRTFLQLTKLVRRCIECVYFPLSDNEDITGLRIVLESGLGMCGEVQVFTNRKHRRPIIPMLPGEKAIRQIQISTPTALMFPVPIGGAHISTVGVYRDGTRDISQSPPTIPIFSPEDDCPLLKRKGHYACASLDRVAYVTIFSQPDQIPRYCLGLLLQYTDGTKEALGQCGIGFLHEQRFVSPSYIQYKSLQPPQNPTYRHILVDFITPEHPVGDYIGMTSYRMTGKLEFWFRNRDALLAFSSDDI